jgi:GAF domain-containing protein
MDKWDIDGVAPAVQLARISRELVADRDEPSTERRIAELAVEAVDAVEHAGVSMRSGSRLRVAAASSGLVETCEELQHRRQEGPCIQAVAMAEMCHVPDTTLDPRWPLWGHRVAEMGVRSVLALPLSAADRNLGSLGLYASTPQAFGATSTALAFAFATHAAVALLFARQSAGFDDAVEARHVIGIAQGILATRYGVSVEVSFALLRRYSNSSNTKLTEVARRVLEEGELPGYLVPGQRTTAARSGGRPQGSPSPSRAGSSSD